MYKGNDSDCCPVVREDNWKIGNVYGKSPAKPEKNNRRFHAASPKWWKITFMLRRAVWWWVSSAVGFCAPRPGLPCRAAASNGLMTLSRNDERGHGSETMGDGFISLCLRYSTDDLFTSEFLQIICDSPSAIVGFVLPAQRSHLIGMHNEYLAATFP